MWQDAMKAGDQDTYIAFLDNNKNQALSNEFYDPAYYDYEASMLEIV